MHESDSWPLEGVAVLEFSRAVAAPVAGLALADLGARVVKLEPVGGEPTRSSGHPIAEDCSTNFAVLNRNKRSITLDLKSEEGRQVLWELIPHFDVFIENNRPGVVKRLGADYGTLSRFNPRLVMLSISAFGQDGPYGDRGGDDKVSQAIAGLMSLNGHDPAGPPTQVPMPVTDYIAGLYGAISILGAVKARETTGKGQYIDLALADSLAWALSSYFAGYFVTGKEPERPGNFGPQSAADGLFTARDGHIFISSGGDLQWGRVCRSMGREDLLSDPRYHTPRERNRHKEHLNGLIAEWMGRRTVKEIAEEFERQGVAYAPVQTIAQASRDPQLQHRRIFETALELGSQKVPAFRPPPHFSQMRPVPLAPPSHPGQHNREVLGEYLGFDAERLEALRRQGVI